MTAPLSIREAMGLAADRAAKCAPPERYVWNAIWWRLYARKTKAPMECLTSARGLFRLAADMRKRPDHYAAKPSDKTDWQWSGLSREQSNGH